jgi:hypothetical protein
MNKPKRQRKYHKKTHPAAKVVGAKGKLRYASAMKREYAKRQIYKSGDASYWADWSPYRHLGTFANTKCGSYTHNGITRYM